MRGEGTDKTDRRRMLHVPYQVRLKQSAPLYFAFAEGFDPCAILHCHDQAVLKATDQEVR